MTKSPKKRACKNRACKKQTPYCSDGIVSPIKPQRLGFIIEGLVIEHFNTTCCNVKMIPAKRNQTVFDATCSKCSKKIQIKTTKLNYNGIRITKPSTVGTCNSPVSIYKFQIKDNKIVHNKSTIYTPPKIHNKSHYRIVRTDKWGTVIEPLKTTQIKQFNKENINKVNRSLIFD